MSVHVSYALAALVSMAVLSVHAQNLFIHSFDRSGQMQWTNSMAQGVYQVEWKSSLTQGSWQTSGVPSVSSSNSVISVTVPTNRTNCFFRVIWTNNAPSLYAVTGVVYYQSEPVTNREVTLMAGSEMLDVTISSITGSFAFGGLSNGMYWINCPGDDIYNETSSGAVISGSNVTANIYLTKPMALISPTNNAMMVSNQPTFNWAEFPGSDHYHLRVFTNDTHQLALSTNVTATTFHCTTPLSEGVTYKWFVSAMDASNNEIAESPGVFLFTVQTNTIPPPVETYSLSGTVYYITNTVTGLPVSLKTTEFVSLNTTTTDVSGAYVFTGLTNGSYYVGSPGNTQYYGNVYYSVTITNGNKQQNLSCSLLLNLVSPADNSTVQPNPPVFAWESFPDTDHYTFELLDSSWTELESTNLVSTNYQTAVSLSSGSRYYWQVTALDTIGRTLAQSPSRSFTFNSNSTLYSLSGTIYNGTNLLAGQVVQLLPPDWITNPAILSTVTSSVTGVYAFTNLLSGNYCVKWMGDATYNPDGPRFYTVTSNITVDAYLWKNMVLISPASNAVVNTSSPTFTWQAMPTADYYTLILSDVNYVQLQRTNVVGTSYQTSVSLPNGSTNLWRLMAFHSADTNHAIARTSFPPPSFTVQLP